MQIEPHKAGLALGGFIGGWHIIWSIFVLLGLGQWLLDFIFELHMIHPTYTVGPFDATKALTLVIVASLVGYVFGRVFALIWNRIHPN